MPSFAVFAIVWVPLWIGLAFRWKEIRWIWVLADLGWLLLAMVSLFILFQKVDAIKQAADENFYVGHIANLRDSVRMAVEIHKNKRCKPAKISQSECAITKRLITELTIRPPFSGDRARSYFVQFDQLGLGALTPEAVNLRGELGTYANFYALRKGSIEKNPYETSLAKILEIEFFGWLFILAFGPRMGKVVVDLLGLRRSPELTAVA